MLYWGVGGKEILIWIKGWWLVLIKQILQVGERGWGEANIRSG